MLGNDVSLLYALMFRDFATRYPAVIPKWSFHRLSADAAFVCRVDGRQYMDALDRVEKRSGDRNLGLRLGSSIGRRSLGLLGTLMASAPTIGAALDALAKGAATANALGDVVVERRDNGRRLHWLPRCAVPQVLIESVLSTWMAAVLSLSGDAPVRPSLDLADAAIGRDVEAEAILRCPVRTQTSKSTVFFPAPLLALRSRYADPVLYSKLSAHLEDCLYVLSGPHSGFLRRIGQAMADQGASDDVSEREIAERTGITVRTLQRRLSTAGSGFRHLRDLLRTSVALHRLDSEHCRVIDIAQELSFSDQAGFCRAVRRWSGRSPRQIAHLFNEKKSADGLSPFRTDPSGRSPGLVDRSGNAKDPLEADIAPLIR
jgi:AraC-like DNA-binding protein